MSALDAGAEPRYDGTVKSWNPVKGWGHIECAETFELYGKDVFLLRSQLLGVHDVSKGQVVQFSLADNGRGPEAASVEAVGAVLGLAAGNGPPQGPALPGSNVGTVKSFNPTSGWGHITCPETEQVYGKDIFFMKSQVPGGSIAKGTQVQFSVQQGLKGPEAMDIRVMGGAGFGGGFGAGFGGGFGAVVGGPQQTPMRGPAVIGGTVDPQTVYYGTIKSFNVEKGWGHVSCTQTQAMFGKDMFLLKSALQGNTVTSGSFVAFQVVMGQKGPEAGNVKVLGSATEQKVFFGGVKLWNEEKGFGFVQCDETRALYAKDIFIHRNALNGRVPVLGDQVQFSVQISPEGRPEATGINFHGGMIGPAGKGGGGGMTAPSYGAWKSPGIVPVRAGPW